MEALLALAMLCQVSVGSPFTTLKKVDQYQLKCQQEYIACYEKKLAEAPEPTNPNAWIGKLKSCVAERKIKNASN